MTSPGAAGQTGVEWGGQPTDGDEAEWPPLHPAERCDGENPMTSRPCVNGHHHGYHRDTTGAEWLDD
ncbi:hypothetical protein [Kribbella sp. DT2]|uniref:hypothetical protein n=1 Tax=Kribbella sp. DT2 TaxID=3393427 RepID=UPI003CEA2E11